MDHKRETLEIIFVIVFFSATLWFLSFAGSRGVVYSKSPETHFVSAPHNAFDIWKGNGVKGRILFLFDRYLSAEPKTYTASEFSEEEFKGGFRVDALCAAVKADQYETGPGNHACSIKTLNELLRNRFLYKAWVRKKKNVVLSDKVKSLVRISQGYRGSFSALTDRQKQSLLRRNRLLIEATYPTLCPKSRDYIVTRDNYIYLSIYQKIIRKIYHIVPDEAWPEVEQTLLGYPFVEHAGGVFRMTIDEGVPVVIMRLKDIIDVREQALLSINGDYWNAVQIERIIDHLKKNTLRSDLVTLSGYLSEESVEMIKRYYE